VCYAFIVIKLASCDLLLYGVYTYQKSFNFIDAFSCYEQKWTVVPFNLVHIACVWARKWWWWWSWWTVVVLKTAADETCEAVFSCCGCWADWQHNNIYLLITVIIVTITQCSIVVWAFMKLWLHHGICYCSYSVKLASCVSVYCVFHRNGTLCLGRYVLHSLPALLLHQRKLHVAGTVLRVRNVEWKDGKFGWAKNEPHNGR